MSCKPYAEPKKKVMNCIHDFWHWMPIENSICFISLKVMDLIRQKLAIDMIDFITSVHTLHEKLSYHSRFIRLFKQIYDIFYY